MPQRRRPRRKPQAAPTRAAPVQRPQFPDSLPRLFYWYDDYDPAQFMGVLPQMQQSPNPQHRAVAESAATLVAHLQQGRPQADYEGPPARCRICGEKLGTKDLTNTFVAWPESTEHYITAHGVWTPQHSWLAAVVLGRADPRSRPPPELTRTFRDSGAWKTRIPGLEASERPAVTPETEAPADSSERPRKPSTQAEATALKMAKVLAKAWEGGDFEEMVSYLYSVFPPDMKSDLVEVILSLADPSWLPQPEAPTNGGGPSFNPATHRPLTEEEMWAAAADDAAREAARSGDS